MGLAGELNEWRSRRRRFREEWQFHRDMAISEFESLGLSHGEARRLAKRRLGSYSVQKRAALRHLHANSPALVELLPWRRIRRSPLATPVLILLTMVVLLLPNSRCFDVLANSISILPFLPGPHVERFVPLTPPNAIPMAFATVTLWCLALLGVAQVAGHSRLRLYWRVWIFAVSTLLLIVALGDVLWATGLQLILEKRWNSDGVQGIAIMAAPFAYVGWAFFTLRVWRGDLLGRCPVCLRRLGMVDSRGSGGNLLVGSLERETVCLHGHGVDVESRWRHTFAADPFA